MATTVQQQTENRPNPTPTSTSALWWGLAFSLLITLFIWVARPYLIPTIPFAPDTGVSHYYWKLPNPTWITRASAWIGYITHQLFFWVLIYKAQTSSLRYTARLHHLNIIALIGNAAFILIHFLQTAIWYDGLAQDVSIFSSQGSVILLLVMVLLMENQRRGLFFGYKVKGLKEPAGIVRYYHGYVFSWAIVYTFWYHPIENTSGHLIGLFYTFLLLLQGSLFFTRIHINKWWTFFQEFTVLVHGTLVAVMQQRNGGSEIWPMFFFGFAALVIVTQMYGLDLPRWARWAVIALFVLGVTFAYNGRWADLNEVLRIPIIEYLSVFVLAGLLWLGIIIKRRVVKPLRAS